jgi:phage-related protein
MKPYEGESKKDLKDLTVNEINSMIAQMEELEAKKQLSKWVERILDAKS